MTNRLFKQGIITTIIGIGILAVVGYLVHKDMENGSTLSDAAQAVSGWIASGVVLLRSKDSIIGRSINKAVKEGKERDNGIHPH
jgi:hypothetical protein